VTLPVAGDGSLRLRFFRFASFEGEYVTGDERRRDDEESARLRLPFAENWDGELTLARSLRVRTMESRRSGNFSVRSYSADGETSWYPRSSTRIGVSFGVGIDRDGVTGVRARYTIAKPSLTYQFSGRGRIEASYALTSVVLTDSPAGTAAIPYTMARGRKEGANHDISVSCDYRLSHRMNLVAGYTGRRFADRDFEHFARTQLRAMF